MLASLLDSLFMIFPARTVALTVLIVSLVAASGLAIGSIKFKGLTLGIPGVMFTGLIFGRWIGKDNLDPNIMAFVRDFGLILFVYAVGVQVGPGFLASLRKRGLPLNLMAATIVLLGAAIAVGFAYLFPSVLDIRAAAGLFAGATTNAPALGSATEALKSVVGPGAPLADATRQTLPAFAIAYPFGLVGVIVAMVLLRFVFRIDPQTEADALEAAERAEKSVVAAMNIELKNANFNGMALGRIPALKRSHVVVSRVRQGDAVHVARPHTKVALGDVLLAVGPPTELEDFRLLVGDESKVDLRTVPSDITTRKVLVTHAHALGQTIDELDLPARLGVGVTRVSRAEVEFTAVGNFRLQFGDRVHMVGQSEDLDAAAREMGDSVRALNVPRLLPIFVGIALGVTLGMLPSPWKFGLPAAVKLGLAAGPMIIAIILARIGRIGPMIWYMPHATSSMLRELGIVLFLIAVGLQAGDGFFDALRTNLGLYWLGLGAAVTLVPLLLVGFAAKAFFKVGYLHTCGLLCGAMTSPSLAFTHTMTASEAPAVAFATVYPLTMIMRVLVAQLIILIFQ